jgi:hypothetical protein
MPTGPAVGFFGGDALLCVPLPTATRAAVKRTVVPARAEESRADESAVGGTVDSDDNRLQRVPLRRVYPSAVRSVLGTELAGLCGWWCQSVL